MEITGQVLEADVRQQRFQVWVDDRTAVSAMFSQGQEELVTSALKDHRSLRIFVRGVASVSPQGRPIRFTTVQELKLLAERSEQLDPTVPAIEVVLADLASRVPEQEWNRLPADLTDNLDHYLYGTPKQ